MKDNYILQVRYGESKAKDSYGHITCSIREDGKRVGYCCGGGFDLGGTSFAEWMVSEFGKEMMKLDENDILRTKQHRQKAMARWRLWDEQHGDNTKSYRLLKTDINL